MRQLTKHYTNIRFALMLNENFLQQFFGNL